MRSWFSLLDSGTDEHDVFECRAGCEFVAHQCQPLGRSDEHPHVAVPQDVADLRGTQQRIHRYESGTRGRRPEDRCDRLDPLVEKYRDPLFTCHTELAQTGSNTPNLRPQRVVIERLLLEGQGRRIGV